jgi:cysteine synthase B
MTNTAVRNEPQLIKSVRDLAKEIGNTPLHQVTRVYSKPGVVIYAKKEWEQLSASVKARAAYNIFRDAIEQGELTKHKILLDATSGNTGIAYAAIGKRLGIGVTLCLPENASAERKQILESYGAKIIFTSRFEGTDGAQERAREMAEADPGRYFYADQYRNDNNWQAHYYGTAVEIINAVPGITHFVAGLGTTGTLVGTGRRLKELKKDIRIVSLQPDSALHALEGWKHLETAMVPAIYDPEVADENLEISTEEAYDLLKKAYRMEHLKLSPSSAANLAGAIRVAENLKQGQIVTVFPDNAGKYGEVMNKLGIGEE